MKRDPYCLGLGIAVVVLFFAIWMASAWPRDNGQWGNSDPARSAWFRSLTQPDNPYQSCCGEADAFEADSFEVEGDHYVAVITDGKGMIPNGTRVPVPNAKMKFDAGNPTGHGVIFMGPGLHVYCYVTPGGA